mmetsp:Transcript_25761/g.74525  ORF Transcript_25761/g.74525 Transcript_25761/m.74525 type:complete len:1189 (+) Transcript_25761:89-3655(+)
MSTPASSRLPAALLDESWSAAYRFENDLNIAIKSNSNTGGENGGNHDEEQSSERFHRPSRSDRIDTSDVIAAAKGVLVKLSACPVDENAGGNGSDADVVAVSGSRPVTNHQAQEVFLELEKIKGVIRGGARSLMSSTMEPMESERIFHKDSSDEMKPKIPDAVENNGHSTISDGVNSDDYNSVLLEKENVCLREVIKQRDMDLAQARAEIKALTTRATEAEHVLQTVRRNSANAHVLDLSSISGFRKNNRSLLGSEWRTIRKGSGHSMPAPVGDRVCIPNVQDGQMAQDHIRAFLRLRPMSKLEMSRRSRNCFDIHDDNAKFTVDSLSGENDFCYDQAFGPDVGQAEIYDAVGSQVVPDLLSGINCCLMAYGLASSGRSFTLTGVLSDGKARFGVAGNYSTGGEGSGTKLQGLLLSNSAPDDPDAGITPRLLRDLFNSIRASPSSCEYVVKCSYVAVYLEKVFDLLQSQEKKSLNVQEDSRGVQIDGACEACCFEENDILGLLQRGRACLGVLSSRMNVEVNRSHSILIIKVRKIDRSKRLSTMARLQLVDLAAFEVPVKVKGQTAQELKITQKCFSAMGNVVKGLVEKGGRVPYTDSKLTSILKDALGGNCRTYLIVTASPSSYSIQEAVSTIRIGQRMRRISTSPRANIDVEADVYKECISTLGSKLEGFVVFAQRLIEASYQTSNDGSNAPSSVLWGSLAQLIDEDRNTFGGLGPFEADCRGSLAVAALERWWKEWKCLNEDVCRPQVLKAGSLKVNTKTESLLSDIQSEVVVLRRQNDLLVQEKKQKEEDMSRLKKEVKLLSLRIAELEHNLNLAEFKEKQAKLFLRQFRKICWNLQKDFLTERRIEIADITANMHGAPDLTGLIGLDTLLLEAGLIATKDIDADDEELAGGNDFLDWSQANGSSNGRDHAKGDENETDMWTTDDEVSGLLGQLCRKGAAQMDLAPERTATEASKRTKKLQQDLRQMTNKCIELQVLLNEERERIGTIVGRNKSLNVKNLTQEVFSLRKELDVMKHNAKAATWKLQELHVVNKVLSKKGKETSEHVATLEEGFQRLQETFRTTVLDSLDADAQLNDRIKSLEAIVDSLTVAQGDDAEFDALGRPVPKINTFPRGHQTLGSNVDETATTSVQRGHLFSGSLKNPDNTLCSRVGRKAKYHKRGKKKDPEMTGREKRGFHRVRSNKE